MPSCSFRPARRRPRRMSAPDRRSRSSAGSTKAAARLGVATRGWMLRPPLAKVSRITAPARSADASSGGVFSTDTNRGRRNRSHRSPLQRSTSSIRRPGWRRIRLAIATYSPMPVSGTRRLESRIHHGMTPSLGRSVQLWPVATSKKGKAAVLGPASRSCAPMASRKRPTAGLPDRTRWLPLSIVMSSWLSW